MKWSRIGGLIVYGVGIVGACQGVIKGSYYISMIAFGVIVVGSIILGMEDRI
jgi:hypothetical protein